MPFLRKELLALILIMLVASFFRLYGLDEIPPGLAGDTAYKGVAAQRVLEGEHPIFFEERWGGVEPMYMYLLAVLFRVTSATPLAIKALSAIIGIVTIPIYYLLVRKLLGSRTVALLASSWLTISYWHISYSRLGWEIILAPLFVIVTLYFFWRALRSGRWRDFLWTGLALGASLYTYQAMRFLPVLIALYVGYRILTDPAFWKAYGLKLTLSLLIALVVFAPLGAYFATHSDAFLRRAREVSIFNPEKNPEGPLRSFASSAVRILGMYNIQGDPLWRHNLSGRPAFDVLTSILFLIGLSISIAKFRDPAYLLLLFWLAVMSLPPILTPPRDVPHFSRSIGALPAACIFPAIGVHGVWKWVKARQASPRVQRTFGLSVLALLSTVALLTYRDYFVIWANTDSLRNQYFDGHFVDLATAMDLLDDPEAVWILPISALASPHDEPGHHTIEFMYRGEAPFHFLRLEEQTAADDLSALSRGHAIVLLVDYRNYVIEEAYNFIDADPKQLAPFLLDKYGQKVEHREFDSFEVLTYQLPDAVDFAIADPLEPVSANYGAQLMLTGAAYGDYSSGEPESTAVPSGREAWVVLQWRAVADLPADYKVALFLLDERERVVGQVDKVLLSNQMRLTSEWEHGQVEMDYYVLPSLPATAPGDYHIELAVYDAATMERLVLQDDYGNILGQSYTIGELRIVEPAAPPVVEPSHSVADGVMVPDVRLLGFDLSTTEVSPGEAAEAALYWEALTDVSNDYVVHVQLRDDEGQIWGQEESRPAYGRYPTTEWQSGEVIRDWHAVPIPADTPDGDYHLYVRLTQDGQVSSEVSLGMIRIGGRARSYEIPRIEHEVGWSLGQGVVLLGYDMDETVRVGETLKLTLHWQCLEQMDKSYTVFTHLLDDEGVIQAQADRIPLSGEAPTTSWLEREVITDEYEMVVHAQAPAGEQVMEIGMYDPDTMQRLPVYDAQGEAQGDRILLGSIRVER